jgi:hypothetical protein
MGSDDGRQSSHIRPGSRVVTSWRSQLLPSGSLKEIGEVGATFRVRAWKKTPAVAVEHLTDLDAAADQVLTCRVDVGDDEFQTLSGAGLGRGEALPE